MPNQYKVGEFVELFNRVYRTIDIRAAMLRVDEEWQAIYVTLRMHMAGPNVVKQCFRSLTAQYGKVESPRFRIVQHCFPFSELEQLVRDFSEGHLALTECKILFPSKKDILSLMGQVPYFRRSANKPEITNWPVLQASMPLPTADKAHGWLLNDREIQRYAELAGYADSYSAVRQLLEVDFENSRTPLLQFELEVPARIDSISARRIGANALQLKIVSTAHNALSGLLCTVRPISQVSRNRPLKQEVIPLNRSSPKDCLRKWTGVAEVSLSPDDYVDVELTYKELGRLCFQSIRPIELLQVEERNPLLCALTFFCPFDTVKDLLERPHVTQAPKNISLKNKGNLYEVSVQWLLAGLGFRAIWLHGYESMKAEKYDYGSIDCLAYHEFKNILLLVNCTTGPPDPHEINRQMELQSRVHAQAFENTTVRLYSVLFTASHRPPETQEVSTDRGVRIFYREDVSKLLALIERGQERRFIDTVVSPR